MGFRRHRPGRRTAVPPTEAAPKAPGAPHEPIDTWLVLTGSVGGGLDGLDGAPAALARLRDRLVTVIDDPRGERSMPPPTAGGMSQEAWDALTEAERNVYRGRQLRSLDPRLLPSSIRNLAGPFDRSPRSASH